MDIKIKRDDFLKGLQLAQSIADRKGTMPILANTLVRSHGQDSIICAGTDLRVSVVTECKAEVAEEGGMSVEAKYLFEIVRSMPPGDIHLTTAENNYATLTGSKAHYQLVGMSDRDFPRMPQHDGLTTVEVDAATLAKMIARTQFSVSTDETRRHLSGIYLEWNDKVARMVSTDGHRLSLVEVELGEGLDLPEGIIIPRKGLIEMRKMLEGVSGTCDLAVDDGNMVVRASDVVLTIKLVDAKFPPFRQVIPERNDKQLVLNRIVFFEALRRIGILASDRNKGIHIELTPGQLRISSDNPDLGEAHEDLEVEYDGEKLNIGFDSRYFIDILNEISDETVVLELSGELDPGLVRPNSDEKYIGVIMPMRI